MLTTKIIGTGSYLPPHIITNEDITGIIGEKNAQWLHRRTGIETRRFASPICRETGRALEQVDELDMAEAAARAAIENAGIDLNEINGLWFVTCTGPPSKIRFSRMAIELKGRLGLNEDAYATQIDSGCGGIMIAASCAHDMILGNSRNTVLIVASNATSPWLDVELYKKAESWLSPYIFGDGAGAMILQKTSQNGKGIQATYYAADPSHPLMYFHDREAVGFDFGNPVYEIDAHAVRDAYAQLMTKAITKLREKHPFHLSDVNRFYFHQANRRLIEQFSELIGAPLEKVAMNVHKYGNLSAASTLVLLDEDRRSGLVKEGETALFCAVGAGIHYGSFLVRF